jgi:branched-chain amino acid transport system permease protein
MKLKYQDNAQKNFILNGFIKHPLFGIVLLWGGFVLLLVLSSFGGGIIPSSVISQLTTVYIYFIVGLGYSILLGYSGLASLGTAGFIGLAGYVMPLLMTNAASSFSTFAPGLPTELVIVIALLIVIVVGVIIGFISLRIEGIYLGIVTLGIGEILLLIFRKWKLLGSGTAFVVSKFKFLGLLMINSEYIDGTYFLGINLSYWFIYFFILIVMLVIIFLVFNLIKSPTGRAMLTMKNSTSAAQSLGISTLKYRVTAFLISAALAGLAGILYFMKNHAITPLEWTLSLSLNILAAVIIGGNKSIFGTLLGSFFVFGLNDLFLKKIPFFAAFPNLYLIINGILIIVVIMFYPGGLVQLFYDIKKGIIKLGKYISKRYKEYKYGKD